MSGRLKKIGVALVVVFAAAQLVRPKLANPATDVSRSIQAQMGTGRPLVAVVDRACRDCHSNGTVWPWYTRIAPLSWLMASGVKEGRKVLNFSEWAAYSAQRQGGLLAASCQAVSDGKMPGVYSLLRRETRLSAQDVETICAAARQAQGDRLPGAR